MACQLSSAHWNVCHQIFVTGCATSCQNYNLPCNHRRKIDPNNISISMKLLFGPGPADITNVMDIIKGEGPGLKVWFISLAVVTQFIIIRHYAHREWARACKQISRFECSNKDNHITKQLINFPTKSCTNQNCTMFGRWWSVLGNIIQNYYAKILWVTHR